MHTNGLGQAYQAAGTKSNAGFSFNFQSASSSSSSGSSMVLDSYSSDGGLRTPVNQSDRPGSTWTNVGAGTVEPDYFASVHVPDNESKTPGVLRIASPFAMPSGETMSTAGSITSVEAASSDSHPWANLFGDGGLKTALPENHRSHSLLVPPTPAAHPDSVPRKSAGGDGFGASVLGKLQLPAVARKSNTAVLPAPSKKPVSEDLSRYRALDVDGLAEVLALPVLSPDMKREPAEDVLVLDIRPSTSFGSARIPKSINVCAPSTLLKRPGITVERIEEEMLGSGKDRRRFMRWRKGPSKKGMPGSEGSPEEPRARSQTISCPAEDVGINKIVVLDTDTSRVADRGNATAGGGGPCLIGMLRKFEAAGYAGELCWLVGGFNNLVSSVKGQCMIEKGPVIDEDERSETPTSQTQKLSSRAIAPSMKLGLDPGSPSVAKSPLSDSASQGKGRKRSLVQPRGLPAEAFQLQSTVAGWPVNAGGNKGGDVHNMTTGVNAGTWSQHQQSACANPFFDNIRQNRELAHGITEKFPMDLPQMSEAQVSALPEFLKRLVESSAEQRATMLAESFYTIEKNEQQRLMATMQQHSAESIHDPRQHKGTSSAGQDEHATSSLSLAPSALTSDAGKCRAFPFSISAALERGADNRYNNIWTYEHSRVRLSEPQNRGDPGSDYLNGSFVEPARQFGSRRRYIATQAPLPTTFEAFWTAIWEQNSRVIVMLTREHESGRLQSHPYWDQTEFGPHIRVEKLEETTLNAAGKPISKQGRNYSTVRDEGGNLFPSLGDGASNSSSNSDEEPTTIRRSFRLRNLKYPEMAPRKLTQFQFIAWPDYHIPESPDSLLGLMDLAGTAQKEADEEVIKVEQSSGRPVDANATLAGPIVVHCSAGVGRTGAYVVIDAILDVLRRQRRRSRGQAELGPWDNGPASYSPAPESKESFSSTDTDAQSRSARTPRRSLKRELSPADMDVDYLDEKGSGVGRDLSSPPPMLRSRSNEESADVAHTMDAGSSWSSSSSSSASTPSRAFGSMQLASSHGSPSLGSALASYGNPRGAQFTGGNTASIPSSRRGSDGLKTEESTDFVYGASEHSQASPSSSPFSEAFHSRRATSSRSSFSSSAATNDFSSSSEPSSVFSIQSFQNKESKDGSQLTDALKPGVSEPLVGKVGNSMPFPSGGLDRRGGDVHSEAAEALRSGIDIVRKSVDTVREQRMSMIQTCRQFVFVYSAVLSGLLRDFKAEGLQ
ncbi:hypothetical protein IE53DRAFT_361840 [Violaceomyces palustris]|uniref:Uncharacterized protein n=1 Tax=Violaceomyces palustris TaxID=1673888 RepID=A0ACD0NZ81_9BASI|nr:hypothetical protein IE53DRAFT_361840 [Violaceomyces palustris]